MYRVKMNDDGAHCEMERREGLELVAGKRATWDPPLARQMLREGDFSGSGAGLAAVPVAELDDALAAIDDAEAIRAAANADGRRTAVPKYEARLRELGRLSTDGG